MEIPDTFLPFVMALLGAGGVYGAVKADLASTKERHKALETKFDRHIEDHAKGAMK